MSKYIPYSNYESTAIEGISKKPSHWELKQVRYLLIDGYKGIKIGPFGSALKLEDMVENGYRVYGQENVIKRDFTLGKRRISKLKFDSMGVYRVFPGDILVTMMGTSGKCEIVPDDIDEGIIDSHLLRLGLKKELILPRFFKILIDETDEIKYQIKIQGKGSIMHGLNSSIVKSLQVPIPPIKEQESILDFLDYETARIDTLIEKQQRLIELLTEKRQAVISHAVTKGLNLDVPMKDSGVEWLGEVPAHWEVKPLKYLVSEPLQYGANEAAIDTDISQPRFVRITDVLPNGDLKKDTFRSLPYEVAKPYMLKDGDVLLARSGGTVGKSFIYRDTWGKCCFAGYLIKARINERFIPAEWFYLNTLTDFYWNWIESIQIQATIQNVSADKYNAFFIAIPPISEAEEIITYIEKNLNIFDALISKAEQAIQLMQERRTALISAAVTGKIDVRDWVKPE